MLPAPPLANNCNCGKNDKAGIDYYEIQKGQELHYHVFSAILTAKEMMRYYIKIVAYRLFGLGIR